MRIALIAAMGMNRVIGRGGALPWRLGSDLAHFKRATLGKPVLMGRKTFQSLGRPLPGRTNLVLTRDAAFRPDGAACFADFDAALAHVRDAEEVMVIGGAEIYTLALPLAGRVHLTEVKASPRGDAFFPVLDPAEWSEAARERVAAGPRDDHDYDIVRYERR